MRCFSCSGFWYAVLGEGNLICYIYIKLIYISYIIMHLKRLFLDILFKLGLLYFFFRSKMESHKPSASKEDLIFNIISRKIKQLSEPENNLLEHETAYIAFKLIAPHSYGHLILDKGAKTIQWNKDSIFNKLCWHNWGLSCRRM